MPENQALKIVYIYLKISDLYDCRLKYHCMRFTNNNKPKFTDVELMTIYIFGISEFHSFNNLQIYKFANDYLKSWFPDLPSYTAFNTRLNNLADVFRELAQILMSELKPDNSQNYYRLLDSMPIITCSGKRNPKVATEIIDKGKTQTKSCD